MWISITVAAAAFLAVVWAGRWWQRKRHQLPPSATALPPSRAPGRRLELVNERELDLPGIPLADTPGGKLFTLIAKGTCPHCKNRDVRFLAGPTGGMSQNIKCEVCRECFNVTAFPNGEGTAEPIGHETFGPSRGGKH